MMARSFICEGGYVGYCNVRRGPPGRSRARGGKVPNEARSTRRITIHDVLLMTALLLVLVDRVQLRIPLVLDPQRLVG